MSAPATSRVTAKASRCHRQIIRAFSSCLIRHKDQPAQADIQPESPRFIYIPEPPQQTLPVTPVVKGFLPVPREIFAGKLETNAQLESTIRCATPPPPRQKYVEPGSRADWRRKIASQRRRNLIEGSLELRHRKSVIETKRDQISKAKVAAREEALHRAMSYDETYTMQSNNFDLAHLMSGTPLPGNKMRAFKQAQARQKEREEMKREERMRDLHSLYTKARSFIVTKEQLDQAIETAFGTDEQPVVFKHPFNHNEKEIHSVWAYGRPTKLSDRLNTLVKRETAKSQDGISGVLLDEVKAVRINRIAETLTGGDLGEGLDDKSM